MATPIKISVIGAGSATFSLGLVKDLCLTEGLKGSLVSFMDINPDRLDMIHKMGERYAKELGTDLQFESTTDQQVSLQDADFVINTAAAPSSSHYHQRAKRDLATKHGYYYGLKNRVSFHQFQLMLNVIRDMEAVCPDAWLIQSGNPVFDGCTLMTRETDIKICGLCHGHYGMYEIAMRLGITEREDLQRIVWQAPGLNHNIWLTHFMLDGEDLYPRVDEWIKTEGEHFWTTHVAERTHDAQMSRGAVHQYQMYDLFPIGDTVRRGGWWYHTDIDTKKHWFGEPWGGPDTELARPFYVENLEKKLAQMTRLANDPNASLIEAFGDQMTHEQQVPIIDALVNNNEGQFQVNVPNRGALEGIPDDVVVELPAVINQKGIQTMHVGSLPKKIMLEQILPEWLDMERNIEAFKTGDRSMLLWDLLESHETQSYDQAVETLNKWLDMEGEEALKAHYTYPEKANLLA
ncbi:MAG: alpha-glucosidase/alpha-galactosidase [Chloroflexota bacterium]